MSLEKIGDVLSEQGKLEEAQKTYQESLAIRQKLAAHDPSNTQWQRDVSVSYLKLGIIWQAQQKANEALAFYQKALAISESLAAHDPSNGIWKNDLSWLYDTLTPLLAELNRSNEAVELVQRQVAWLGKQEDSPEVRQALANAYLRLASYELFNRQPEQAIEASERGLEIETDEQMEATLHTNLAHGYLLIDQYEKAKAIYLYYKEKMTSDGRSFKQAVLDDFQEFRQRGIIHTDMERMEKLLAQ